MRFETEWKTGAQVNRSYYSETIENFIARDASAILGILAANHFFALESTQRDAWQYEIELLQRILQKFARRGKIHFEFSVPRLGKRIDVALQIDSVVFVLEFKVGESSFGKYAHDQVWDYALDLKNFHDTSRNLTLVPILIATQANNEVPLRFRIDDDKLVAPIHCNSHNLQETIERVLELEQPYKVSHQEWEKGRYCPTPTIVEAAMCLYRGHRVDEISRSDASAINLSHTTDTIAMVIAESRAQSQKSICFVTGVPGAGKTLVGLNIATKHIDKASDLYSVFLSGNGPLVSVLCEALTRDRVQIAKAQGNRLRKGQVKSEVQMFIQNIRHFRDDCLAGGDSPPLEHVVLFDEAQRAWNLEQTASFMKRKRGQANFQMSEPEFLISCMDRHKDWAVIVCLVGGGQEINTGEAGISEWINSLQRSFPNWAVYISNRLTDSEYGAGEVILGVQDRPHVTYSDFLHLSVSMRSYRAENVSLLVKQILDLETAIAQNTYQDVGRNFPIYLTRDLDRAKSWVRSKARGTERYGLVASSQAQRLKPHAIDVKSPIDPVHWFLDGKDDVRSSYYLEDVATEFHVQGLELDWACLTWDADLRFENSNWQYRSFCGSRWNRINKPNRKQYLLNAYRVLLTRARQGMVIFVPPGDDTDHTRLPAFYDGTYDYLRSIGFLEVPTL